MAGVDLPVRAIREQVAGAVDLIIQQARLKDGTRRITAITEVVGMEGDVITLQDLFTFDFAPGVTSGPVPRAPPAHRLCAQVRARPGRPRASSCPPSCSRRAVAGR